MKKMQYLTSSRSVLFLNHNKVLSKVGKIKAAGLNNIVLVREQIEKLNAYERQVLHKQVTRQLLHARRLANSGAFDYDVNQHIRLYLLNKSL
jgi:hypothetical protein